MIGDQIGIAYVLTDGGTRLETPFIDLRDRLTPLLAAFDERGLLALAFHPDFARNGLFYVNYSAKRLPESPFTGKTAYTWRLSEFKVSANDPNRADRASERVLLELDWVNRKHNGGGLAFGPDVEAGDDGLWRRRGRDPDHESCQKGGGDGQRNGQLPRVGASRLHGYRSNGCLTVSRRHGHSRCDVVLQLAQVDRHVVRVLIASGGKLGQALAKDSL